MRGLGRVGGFLRREGQSRWVRQPFFTSDAGEIAYFKHFGAYVGLNVAADHEKSARGCEQDGLKELSPNDVTRRWESASPWPSRRGWLREVAASTGKGNGENANADGPTTIAE